MENILGVMGGMGPMATQLFYKMLIDNTDASCDQEHINVMIIGHATMPDRTEAILSGRGEEVYRRLLDDAHTLCDNGCSAIAITCNTSHYFVERLQEEIDVPIINMIQESTKEAAGGSPDGTGKGLRTAILATDGTIKTGIYQKALEKEGAPWYIPSEKTQKLVMYEIYDRVKNGKHADMDAWKKIEEELDTEGCGKIILACTELSVICEEEGLSDRYLDSMKVLALRSIEFMGKTVKRK